MLLESKAQLWSDGNVRLSGLAGVVIGAGKQNRASDRRDQASDRNKALSVPRGISFDISVEPHANPQLFVRIRNA